MDGAEGDTGVAGTNRVQKWAVSPLAATMPRTACPSGHVCEIFFFRNVLHVFLKGHILQRMDYRIQSPTQLSAHLRSLRKAKGLSQQQLGELLGVGQSRIARIENQPGSVSVDQFLAVLAALRMQVLLRPLDAATPPDDEAW
jgi:HTH-type transcriptional regulator/antitoxin HipB